MSTEELAIDALVGLGVTLELLCCLGLLLGRDAFDRLHYAAAATTLPPILIAAAVLVAEGFTQPGINALLVAGLLLFLNPLVANATARAARVKRAGVVHARPEEKKAG